MRDQWQPKKFQRNQISTGERRIPHHRRNSILQHREFRGQQVPQKSSAAHRNFLPKVAKPGAARNLNPDEPPPLKVAQTPKQSDLNCSPYIDAEKPKRIRHPPDKPQTFRPRPFKILEFLAFHPRIAISPKSMPNGPGSPKIQTQIHHPASNFLPILLVLKKPARNQRSTFLGPKNRFFH